MLAAPLRTLHHAKHRQRGERTYHCGIRARVGIWNGFEGQRGRAASSLFLRTGLGENGGAKATLFNPRRKWTIVIFGSRDQPQTSHSWNSPSILRPGVLTAARPSAFSPSTTFLIKRSISPPLAPPKK